MLTVSFRETGIAYRIIGREGAPWLVMCHGMALDSDDLESLATALSSDWRIVLWDMPGHGESGPLPPSADAAYMAAALSAVIDHCGVMNPVILGFSFGGVVAQYLHRSRPDLARALILYGCFAPFSQKPLVPRWLVRPLVWQQFERKPWAQVREHFAAICAKDASVRKAIERKAEQLGQPGFLTMSKALLRSCVPDPAFRITVPMLLLSGAEDVNRAGLVAAHDGLTGCARQLERVSIADAGHCAHHDQPDAFLQAVTGFLNRIQ